MFSYLLGIITMTIYNQTYGTSSVMNMINRYNRIMNNALKLSAFSSMLDTIKILAVGFTVILYFIDLGEKVTERNFSIEQFMKATLRCVVSYMFIMNADTISGYLLNIADGVANDVDAVQMGFDFFSSSNPNNKTMLINGLRNFKVTELLSYIAYAILPWAISMIGEIILQVVLISRILEIVVMTTFCPLAISDIYREGTASPGVRYMKRILALGMQIVVILLINVATQSIVMAIAGGTAQDATNAGSELVSLLRRTTISGSVQDALADGSLVFTKASLTKFLDALVGKADFLKVLGVHLARLGLIWGSMPLCEEITGVK